LLIILITFVVACTIYRDYGVTWDEVSQRTIGLPNLEVIRTLDANIIDTYGDWDHGASFELALVGIERLAGAVGLHEIIPLRHICTFAFFLIGAFCGYLLMLRMYKRQWIAILGLFMLLLHPRIFAHAFFNSKDVPFLAAFLIALYAICIALLGGRTYQYVLAGAACGFAAGIRVLGGLLVALVMILLIAQLIHDKDGRKLHRQRLLLFLGFSLLTLYATWPSLWYHPIDNLRGALRNMSQFSRFDTNVLFRGEMIYCSKLPWYYVPYWIGISTPVLWLMIGISGIGPSLYRLSRRPATILLDPFRQMLAICVAACLLPLISVAVLHSIVYDDWRHLYFTYPPFVVVGLYSIAQLEKIRWARVSVIGACFAQVGFVVAFLVKAHPFQQVYFNALVPHKPEYLRQHFDMEYWGASYKQGFAYLLAHDHRESIPVVQIHTPLRDNVLALPPEERLRIRWAPESEKGAYLMSNFRVHPGEYPYRKVWGIQREGSTIMQIYRIE
jgi:hypothetical protein